MKPLLTTYSPVISGKQHNKTGPGRSKRRQIVPLKDKDGHYILNANGTIKTRVILHPVYYRKG